jgi:hypothetical protein
LAPRETLDEVYCYYGPGEPPRPNEATPAEGSVWYPDFYQSFLKSFRFTKGKWVANKLECARCRGNVSNIGGFFLSESERILCPGCRAATLRAKFELPKDWSPQMPTREGWYFKRDKYGQVTAVEVAKMCTGELIVCTTVPCEPLETYFNRTGGDFAGPFSAPPYPEKTEPVAPDSTVTKRFKLACESCGNKEGDKGVDGPVSLGRMDGKLLCSDCRDALAWAWEH